MESEGLTMAVDAADTGQGRSTSECGHSSCEQTAQEILPVEIIVQGEMIHQPGRILSEESQGSVESDRLSTLDPLIHNDMPASPPQNHRVWLYEPDRGEVSFEEAIRCLNESQPEKLRFRFKREVDGYDEAYKEHRHQFIHAVSTCQSLKKLTITDWHQKLSIEEVQLLCQNLLPALNSLTLDGALDNDGVEIVCEKMAHNCVLKKLALCNYHGSLSNAGASLGSMLAVNSTLDSLDLSCTGLGPNGVEALLEPLTGHATARPRNKSLTHLRIDGDSSEMGQGAGEAIAHMLRTNDTLTHFDFPCCNLESDVCKILESLQKNHTLLSLELGGCKGVKGPDVSAKLMDLFQMNRSLTNIGLPNTALEQSDVCKILESLQKNQTLRSLCLAGCEGVKGPDVSAKLMDLFQMNRSLTHINLVNTPLEQSDVCKILESLQKNQTLRSLRLSYCKGVKGPDVLAKMMDLVRMHPCLMEIALAGTPLYEEGQAAQVKAQLENNAKDYMAVLRGMPRVPPKFVRVFLCGNAYSGKTTLGRSMKRAFATSYGSNLFLPLMEVIELRKPFKFCSNDPDELSKRTRGIEINVLLDDTDQKISLWDLAGQEEYHAFHDMMMPDLSSQGNVSYFLLVCNPFDRESGESKSLETIKEELRSWLRFISSNTKRSFNFPPHITIVITNEDKGFIHKEFVESDVKELASQFQDYINLSLTLHSINAHSSRQAKAIVEDVTTTCTNVLHKLPHVFKACVNVQHGLCDWIKEHPYQPIVTMETFKNDIVAKKESSLKPGSPTDTDDKNLNPHEAVALFLHDAGEIIYFKDTNFVVVNPHWFCHQVMGHLIKLRRHVEEWKLTKTIHDGLITVSRVESLLKLSLKNATHWLGMNEVSIFQNLIQLMIKMDLAYKDDMADHPGDHVANLHPNDTLFVPTTLEFKADVAKGERRLRWSECDQQDIGCDQQNIKCDRQDIYIGRRLQCRDEDVTTLTPGFFPRVQVVLKRHFVDLKMGAICENEINLMKICVNGLEIFVELSGNQMPGHAFIDILVKSSKSEIQTIQLVHDHVLSRIEHLCGSPQGCQGVTLMRGVLRPRAVKKLLLCKNRTKQVALVEDLKKELLAANLDFAFLHTWPQVDVQKGDHDFLNKRMEDEVASLLGEVATHDVLEQHLQSLKKVEIDINNLPSFEQESEHTQGETSKNGDLPLQKSFHRMSLQEPTNLEQLIRDIMRAELRSSEERIVARISTKLEEVFEKTKQEIKCMEEWLYKKLTKKLDGMTKLFLQLHQQQIPCNAFFTTGGTKQQRQLVNKLMGIEVTYLHFLCEDIDGIHVVDDQKGDEIRYVKDENRHKIAHLVIVSFKIMSVLLKVAAHVVGGMGNLVPNVAQGLALAYDAEDITDYIEDLQIHGGPIVGQNSTSHLPTVNDALIEKHRVATQWLVDFLRGKNISKLFGLSRVRYLNSSHGDLSTIRWVCSRHKNEGLNSGTLENCPA
ncbi:hypothetical protein CY35_18G008000 [Sphagnum magellanicum]|nr:hypothetical protein CY35_18G008000 [Sphagnum magellanicum]